MFVSVGIRQIIFGHLMLIFFFFLSPTSINVVICCCQLLLLDLFVVGVVLQPPLRLPSPGRRPCTASRPGGGRMTTSPAKSGTTMANLQVSERHLRRSTSDLYGQRVSSTICSVFSHRFGFSPTCADQPLCCCVVMPFVGHR